MMSKHLAAAVALATSTLAISAADAAIYEKVVTLGCSANICSGFAPAVPAGKVVDLETVACQAVLTANANTGVGGVNTQGVSNPFVQTFKMDAIAADLVIAPTQPIPMRIKSGKKPQVSVIFNGNPTISSVKCYLRGTRK
jgi:hypothetical protein